MPSSKEKPVTMDANSAEVAAKMAAAMAKFNPRGYGAKPIPPHMQNSEASSKNSSDPVTINSSPETTKHSSHSTHTPLNSSPFKLDHSEKHEAELEQCFASSVDDKMEHAKQPAHHVSTFSKTSHDNDMISSDASPSKHKRSNAARTWNNSQPRPGVQVPLHSTVRQKTVRLKPGDMEEAEKLMAIHGGTVYDHLPDRESYGVPAVVVAKRKLDAANAAAKQRAAVDAAKQAAADDAARRSARKADQEATAEAAAEDPAALSASSTQSKQNEPVVLDVPDLSMTYPNRTASAERSTSARVSSVPSNEIGLNNGRPFVPSKPMGLEDVVNHHTKNGDYERQKQTYGPNYAQVLTNRVTMRPTATQLSIPGATIKVVPSTKANQFTTPTVKKAEQKTIAAPEPACQPAKLTGMNLQYPEAVDRVHYPVPKLGCEAMPLIKIRSFPTHEKLSTQVSNRLAPHLRDIPPPVYAFSKKPKLADDPETTGAKPAPARTSAPLPNPFDPTSGLVVKVKRDEHGEGEGREASIFGDEDLPPAATKVLEESVPVVSRWRWYSRSGLSVHGDLTNYENREVCQQLSSEWDHRVDANAWSHDEHGELLLFSEESREMALMRINRIDTWMSYQFANTIAQPYNWDMDTPGFRSGKLPCSGLRYDYQEFPADMAQDPVTIYYGPIDWDAIREPKLSQQAYKDKRFNQTSTYYMEKKMASLNRHSEDAAAVQETRRQMLEQREATKKKKEQAIALADSSKALLYDNPYKVQGKIYIRPVNGKDDVKVMAHIYNYYITQTIDAPEINKITVKDLEAVLTRSTREGYPCLVAVLCVDPGDPPVHEKLCAGMRHNGTQYPVETPVGFAYAKSWGGIGVNAFTDVATAQVFVSPQYVARKIGTNLLDRLIGCIDRDYQTKQGAEIKVPDDGPQWNRQWTLPQTIVLRWFYDDINTPYVQGRKHFLEEHFGMVETGKLVNSLSKNKNRTRYSMIQFQREANRFWKPEDDAAADPAIQGFW